MPLEDSRSDTQSASELGAFTSDSPAGFWVRLLAYLIDGFIITFAFSIILVVFSRDDSSDLDNLMTLVNLATLVYHTALIAIWATTAGKRLFRLYVVRIDGSRVGPGRAMARSLATVLSFLLLGIGFLMIAFREDKRGLHDLICDTVVIKRYRQPV